MFSAILKLIAPLVKWFTSADETEPPPPEVPESIRTRARHEGDRMADCFRRSQEAFARNEKGLAKELSLEGKAHRENMERLNKEASAKIFQEYNRTCPPNTVDLHGLYVLEAELYFKSTCQQVQDRGESSLRVIVGKGNHSDGNAPKIKPAIMTLAKSLGMTVEVDPLNEGCLLVMFT
ncbi:DUF1771-domain-containing protein [Rhizopogon salebrosus TDB-379]|nr:DUF1771-domain-containing protein [Rhizopogon salebrosus TDB-379]